MTLHQTARAYAIAGTPVFPCVENGKAPATANGFKDATCSLDQIDAWWNENPDYNIGLPVHQAGLCVIDLDPPIGEISWLDVLAHEGLVEEPLTRVIVTPSGGRHLYFRGELPPRVSKLGKNIDTRGVGSYVLVPPSIIDGKEYKLVHDCIPLELPEWIRTRMESKSSVVAAAADITLDLPGSIQRARSLLKSMVAAGDVARESTNDGETRTFQLCCEMCNLGLSNDAIQDLILEIWNPHCEPPWSADELGGKIQNASLYAQNERGAWGVAPAAETFGKALDTLAKYMPPEKRSRFHPETEDEQENGEDPTWLIDKLIQEKTTVLFVGATQSYKSFLALDLALGISAGIETFGFKPAARKVFYCALEGKTNIKRARRRAWKLGRQIDTKLENFFVMTAPMIAVDGEVQEFGDEIARLCGQEHPALIIFDTASKSMAGLNENDAKDAGRFIRFCDSLVEVFHCAVLAIHHTGKDDARGPRGSSAFHAGFDSLIEVKANRASKAVEVWVRKHKDAEEPEAPWTFQGKVLGPSLVFFPTDAATHKTLTMVEDCFEPRSVGAALQRLNAHGDDHAVTALVLATELIAPHEGESVDARQTVLTQACRKLGSLAKSKLVAYCVPTTIGNAWCLPARKEA